MKEIEINGCVSLPSNVSHNEFLDKFIEWVDSNGWTFGGGTKELDSEGRQV
jgi:hypothetical protein